MTRRQALALSLAGVAAAGTGTRASAQSPGAGGRLPLPTRATLARLGLERAWFAMTPLGTPTEKVMAVNLAEDSLFVQTDKATLHSFDAETGKLNWSVSLGRDTLDSRPVSVNSDHAFVTNGPRLIALDRRTGRVVWSRQMDATAEGATAANENRVIVGLASGKLVGYNIKDRSQAKPPGPSAGSFAWAWQTGQKITARPIPAGRVVAFASQDSRLYVAQDDPKVILYRYLTGGPIIGSMGTYGTRTLIVPSMDGILYAIDLFTGETKWKLSTGAPIDQEPIIDRERVLVVNQEGRVMVVDAKSGELLRTASLGGGRLIAVSEGRGYVESPDHDLAIVDRTTGQIAFSPRDTRDRAGLDLRDFAIAVPNHLNDRLYFCTKGGFLLSLREAGQTIPRPLRDPNAPKFGYLPPDGDPPVTTPPDSPKDEEPAEKPAEDMPAEKP